MKVIGLNPFGHDTSAALVADGHLVSAVAEERLSRVKHDRSFPIKSVEALLAKHDLTIKDVDAIGINLDVNYHIEQFYYNLDYPRSIFFKIPTVIFFKYISRLTTMTVTLPSVAFICHRGILTKVLM